MLHVNQFLNVSISIKLVFIVVRTYMYFLELIYFSRWVSIDCYFNKL